MAGPDRDFTYTCAVHQEFRDRIDQRWEESWCRQNKINKELFDAQHEIRDKSEGDKMELTSAINDLERRIGAKVAKIMGGIGVVQLIAAALLLAVFGRLIK